MKFLLIATVNRQNPSHLSGRKKRTQLLYRGIEAILVADRKRRSGLFLHLFQLLRLAFLKTERFFTNHRNLVFQKKAGREKMKHWRGADMHRFHTHFQEIPIVRIYMGNSPFFGKFFRLFPVSAHNCEDFLSHRTQRLNMHFCNKSAADNTDFHSFIPCHFPFYKSTTIASILRVSGSLSDRVPPDPLR